MSKPPRPTVVEKIQAKQAAEAAPQAPPFGLGDIVNLAFAARKALPMLEGDDLVNVSLSLRAAEALVKFHQQLQAAAQAAAAKVAPATAPAAPAPEAAKA